MSKKQRAKIPAVEREAFVARHAKTRAFVRRCFERAEDRRYKDEKKALAAQWEKDKEAAKKAGEPEPPAPPSPVKKRVADALAAEEEAREGDGPENLAQIGRAHV